MGFGALRINIGGFGGSLLRLHRYACSSHCDPGSDGSAHGAASTSYSYGHVSAAHGYRPTDASCGDRRARSYRYAGPYALISRDSVRLPHFFG